MRRVLKFLKWTGITIGTLLVLFIAINAFDETLDPGAAALINAPSKIKPEQNAYFFLIGLRAPPDRDPGEFGHECVTRLIKTSESGKETSALFISGKTGCTDEKPWLAWADISAISCERQEESCFSHYQKQRTAIKQVAENNKLLLQRYERLLAMEYFDDASYANLLTTSLFLDPVRELYSAVSATKLQEGDAEAFIQRTANQIRFYRMISRGNGSFLSKLVSMVYINGSVSLASDAVRENPRLAEKYEGLLLSVTQPFSVSERGLESAMVAELKSLASTLSPQRYEEELSFYDKLLSPFYYKYNATLNRFYRDLPGWRDLSQLSTEQYLASEKAALARVEEPWHDGYLHMIYNPMGKTLLGLSGPTYAKFPRRAIDLDGRLRLVSLQIQIAAQQIPESEIPAFLKHADPKFSDPYTGQPMQWDKSRGLYFRGHSDRIPDKDGFISVKL